MPTRTLIIPDLHHHTANADHGLQTVKHDRVVFLGDFFDDYEDTVEDATRTAHWLCRQMENPDAVFLFGNHDPKCDFELTAKIAKDAKFIHLREMRHSPSG